MFDRKLKYYDWKVTYFGLGNENNVRNSTGKPLGMRLAVEDRKEETNNIKSMLRECIARMVGGWNFLRIVSRGDPLLIF